MTRQSWIQAGICLGSLAAGAAAGYFYAKMVLEDAYDARLEEEIRATTKALSILHKHEQFSTVESAADTLLPTEAEALKALYKGDITTTEDGVQYETAGFVATEYDHAKVTDEPVNYAAIHSHIATEVSTGKSYNIFDSSDADAIDGMWEAEVASREGKSIYVVSQTEYEENESHYALIELTWYLEDSTLTDDRDDMIDDVDALVGRQNLERFGEWSHDIHVVYIRNDRVGAQYCVTRVETSFGQHAGF